MSSRLIWSRRTVLTQSIVRTAIKNRDEEGDLLREIMRLLHQLPYNIRRIAIAAQAQLTFPVCKPRLDLFHPKIDKQALRKLIESLQIEDEESQLGKAIDLLATQKIQLSLNERPKEAFPAS